MLPSPFYTPPSPIRQYGGDRAKSAAPTRPLSSRTPRPHRILSAPGSRPEAVRPRTARSVNVVFSRSDSARTDRTRRDSVFSPWTSRAASARQKWDSAALEDFSHLELEEDEQIAWSRLQERDSALAQEKDAQVQDVLMPRMLPRAAEQQATSENEVKFESKRPGTWRLSPSEENRARPKSAKAVAKQLRQHPVTNQQSDAAPRRLTTSGTPITPKPVSVAPFHTTHIPSLRRSIQPKLDVNVDVINQEGLFPLMDRGRIPHTADVSRCLLDGLVTSLRASQPSAKESDVPKSTHVELEARKPPLITIDVPVAALASPTPCPSTPTNSKVQSLGNLKETAVTTEAPENVDKTEFLIYDGVTVETSPTYQWFADSTEAPMLAKGLILDRMETFCRKYGIGSAEVSCRAVFRLLERPLVLPITRDDLLGCLANGQKIRKALRLPEHRFHDPDAAPTLIQSWWRMMKLRHAYTYRIRRVRAAKVLWGYWRLRRAGWEMRRRINEKRITHLEVCTKLTLKLKREWNRNYKNSKRIMIHLPPRIASEAEYRFPDLGRLMDLKDSETTLVLITPVPYASVKDQVQHYMQMSFSATNSVRLHNLYPEALPIFKGPSSPASWVLASPSVMRILRELTSNRECVLIPDAVGSAEIQLSAELKIPLMTLPSSASATCTASKLRKFLEVAGAPTLPGIALQDASRDRWVSTLQDLVKEHPEIRLWRLDVDIPRHKLVPARPDHPERTPVPMPTVMYIGSCGCHFAFPSPHCSLQSRSYGNRVKRQHPISSARCAY
ncbi:uncharacterized protein EV422DRAFT_381858 [Fimicolochytrium jonesii]|uniref:uncharacterized protein n=1 Tax=Fimicolochytrium jonesii TaxID=1396493 RepID=UPI0022FEB61B|nr:uncharacterized protein EV422DRAFT_381858 [Fimicolochytrium jonesii]KAI8822871.1 hypothetical protein EV422DRAFT_381858 [Fimicolochytrium jonesii]